MYKSKLNREYGATYGCAKCLNDAYWKECEENHLQPTPESCNCNLHGREHYRCLGSNCYCQPTSRELERDCFVCGTGSKGRFCDKHLKESLEGIGKALREQECGCHCHKFHEGKECNQIDAEDQYCSHCRPTPSQNKWEEEFRELFQPMGTNIKYVNVKNFVVVEEILKFISQLLAQQKKELIEEIEGMKIDSIKTSDGKTDENDVKLDDEKQIWNDAIETVLDELKE